MVEIEPSHEQETIMVPKTKLGTSHEIGKKKWSDCQFSLFQIFQTACDKSLFVLLEKAQSRRENLMSQMYSLT